MNLKSYIPFYKRNLNLAIPVVITQTGQMIVQFADNIMVGHLGTTPFAGVAFANTLISILLVFFTCFTQGLIPHVGHNYGRGNHKSVADYFVNAAILDTILCGFIVLSLFATPLMHYMGQDAQILPYAKTYYIISVISLIPLVLFFAIRNFAEGIGITKHVMYITVICNVLNIVLNWILIYGKLGAPALGVAGAAYATVLSQIISSILVLMTLTKTTGIFKLHWNKIKMHEYVMREIFHIGFPTALQQSITSFSNVFVQSYINAFGSSVMAAWSAYVKIDHFALIPLDSISMSITTFVGQNLGVHDVKRAEKGTRNAIILAFAATAAVTVPILIFAPHFIALFNKEAEVIEYGVFLLRFMTPFYSLVAVNSVLSGTLCGSGDTRFPTVIRLFSFVVFRQIYLFVVTGFTDSFMAVALGYPLGWILSAVLGSIYYLYKKREIEIRFSE